MKSVAEQIREMGDRLAAIHDEPTNEKLSIGDKEGWAKFNRSMTDLYNEFKQLPLNNESSLRTSLEDPDKKEQLERLLADLLNKVQGYKSPY